MSTGGVCMVREVCIVKGGMCGEERHLWQRGACVVGGMHGEGAIHGKRGVHSKGEHTW